MTGPTQRTKTIYECNICKKPYVRKACFIKHMKNAHNEDVATTDKEFLDSTTYSELDRDETILRTVGQILTAESFGQDVSDYEEENFGDPTESALEVINITHPMGNQDMPSDMHNPEPPTTTSTTAPVPLCTQAQKYIIQRGETLPASFLSSVLPAPGFLAELNKSLEEQEDSVDVTNLLITFE